MLRALHFPSPIPSWPVIALLGIACGLDARDSQVLRADASAGPAQEVGSPGPGSTSEVDGGDVSTGSSGGSSMSLDCMEGTHQCGDACSSDTDQRSCGDSCVPCPVPEGGLATCDGTSCGAVCPERQQLCGPACIAEGAACEGVCPLGTHDCAGACVSNSETTSCGPTSCTDCPVPEHGTATCDGTQCGFTCGEGFHACDALCVPDADVATCGTSCQPCPVPLGGAATCNNGTCGVSCAGGAPCGGQCCGAGQQCNEQMGTCAALPSLGQACTGQCAVNSTCFQGRCCETQCVSGTACDTLGRCDECFLHELENGLGTFDCGGPTPREPITYCVDAGGDIRDRARAACEACLGGVCTEVLCEGGLGYTRTVEGVSLVYMFEPGCASPGQVWSNVAGEVTHTF